MMNIEDTSASLIIGLDVICSAERRKEKAILQPSRLARRFLLVMIVVLLVVFPFLLFSEPAHCQASWPTSWIQVDWDKNEDGVGDDWRDVEYAYYQSDSSYLYLKLECYDIPGKDWPDGGRYKWFIDLEGDMYHSGENVYEAEYMLFVEDANSDGFGELYLLNNTNDDATFNEYEPWPPGNYTSYEVTDPNIGDWRTAPPYQIEMYVSWDSIGSPSPFWMTWATDQQNPNLDQGPTTDHVDEEEPIQGIVKHYLTVISPYGTPGGEGWYANCTNAYAALDCGVVDHGNGTRRVFTHWSGDASGINFTCSDPIHMDQNKTAIANWKTQYYLTVISPYDTPGGEDWYDSSTDAYATLATDTEDHGNGTRRVFTHWSGDASGTTLTSDPIHMDGPKTATANWKTQYYLTVSSDHGAIGGEGWYDADDTAYATVTPLTVPGPTGVRYVFTHWSGDASGNTSPSNTITMDGPKTAVANWKTQYKLTVKTEPSGLSPGPTPPTDWYDESTNVVLTAKMVGGYTFDYWDVDGGSKGSGVNPITVHMDGPHTATAHYYGEPTETVGGYALPITLDLGTSSSLILQISLASVLFAVVVATIFLVKRGNKTLKWKH